MNASSGQSIRRTDLLALSNLRHDGRKAHELRRISIQLGPLESSGPSVTGSALFEMGLTSALASVQGPLPCDRRSDERPDRAVVQVHLAAAPFGQADRRVVNARTDRRWMEATESIQAALQACILLELYPRLCIQVHVTLLSDDGGKLGVCLNAATLACMDAGIPMKDFICACTSGYSNSNAAASSGLGKKHSSSSQSTTATTLVDLNRREESSSGGQAAVTLTAAILPQRGTLVVCQSEARLPNYDTLETVLEAAMEGCRAVYAHMQAAVRERASTLVAAKAGRAMVQPAAAG